MSKWSIARVSGMVVFGGIMGWVLGTAGLHADAWQFYATMACGWGMAALWAWTPDGTDA